MTQETTQTGVSELVPTPDLNPRNAAMAEIAKRAAQQHQDETQEAEALYGDARPAEEQPSEVVEQPQEAVEPEAPEAVPEGMVRVKVNGIERLVPQEELITRFQKAEAAEEKFQEAARMRREAEELVSRLQAPAQTMTEQDVLTAIRLGTDDEAQKAWQAWQQEQANLTAQTARQVVERKLAEDRFQEFARGNADLLGDPITMGALQAYEEALMRSGFQGSDQERWSKAAEVVRQRFQPTSQKVTAAVSETREARKATIVNPPVATARRAAPEQPKAPSTQDLIESMRARRMKGRGF